MTEEAGPQQVGVGGVGLQPMPPREIFPRGTRRLVERFLQGVCERDAVRQEELHAGATGTDERQVGRQPFVGEEGVAPLYRLFGGGEVVDIHHEVTGGDKQALLLPVRKDTGGSHVRQRTLFQPPETLGVVHPFADKPRTLSQPLAGGDKGVQPTDIDYGVRDLVPDGRVEKGHDTFFHNSQVFNI